MPACWQGALLPCTSGRHLLGANALLGCRSPQRSDASLQAKRVCKRNCQLVDKDGHVTPDGFTTRLQQEPDMQRIYAQLETRRMLRHHELTEAAAGYRQSAANVERLFESDCSMRPLLAVYGLITLPLLLDELVRMGTTAEPLVYIGSTACFGEAGATAAADLTTYPDGRTKRQWWPAGCVCLTRHAHKKEVPYPGGEVHLQFKVKQSARGYTWATVDLPDERCGL